MIAKTHALAAYSLTSQRDSRFLSSRCRSVESISLAPEAAPPAVDAVFWILTKEDKVSRMSRKVVFGEGGTRMP